MKRLIPFFLAAALGLAVVVHYPPPPAPVANFDDDPAAFIPAEAAPQQLSILPHSLHEPLPIQQVRRYNLFACINCPAPCGPDFGIPCTCQFTGWLAWLCPPGTKS